MQTRKGQNIEDESMQVIDNEVGPHSYNELEWPIVRRMIHATAVVASSVTLTVLLDFSTSRIQKILEMK